MQNLESLKYAELRKLAKKAGIKANQKQDKLVAALQKYYENEKKSFSSNVKPTTPKNTPQSKSKSATPLHSAKKNTPGSKKPNVSTPGKGNLMSPKPVPAKAATPKVATPKAATPKVGNTKVAAVVRSKSAKSPKVATPVRAKIATPISRTPVGAKVVSGTPGSKTGTPKQPATPASTNKAASRWEKKVFNSNKKATPLASAAPGSGKRKAANTPEAPSAKKRRSTFETMPTPELNTPVVKAPKSGEKRRSGRTPTAGSPGVSDMRNAMKPEMSVNEMKESLMSVIDKKVQDKVKNVPSGSSIPRFAAFLKKRDEGKPVTPGNKDWKKIHKKNFDKFDSIDVYLEKKRKRAEEITASVKKARHILEEVHTAVDKLKAHKTPKGLENKKPRVSNPNKTTPFKPTVLNTTSMNLNFGAMKSSPKTMPRKSPKSMLPPMEPPSQTRKSVGSALPRKSMNTPFKFTAMNTTLESTSKKKFDLKASLARPITWKTHKGKLKPLTTEIPAFKKPISTVKAKQERQEARKTVANRRADKKDKAKMARRGIKC